VVDLCAEVRLPAASSADAVNAGVLVGFAGLLESLAAAVAAAAGLADAPHLLTGGHAGLYLDRARLDSGLGRLDFEHVPDLVHQGLRWLATKAWSC
jgi:pantothenate kinase type III